MRGLKGLLSIVCSAALGYFVYKETTMALGFFCFVVVVMLQSIHMMMDDFTTREKRKVLGKNKDIDLDEIIKPYR